MSQPLTLKISDWDVHSIKYMPPRVSDRGAKSVNMISSQTNRSLHLTTPLMMTWGISDYVDEQGVSDGRFTMTLNFPGEGYETVEYFKSLKIRYKFLALHTDYGHYGPMCESNEWSEELKKFLDNTI